MTVQSTVFKQTLETHNKNLICHNFTLDAEKEDNGTLLFDKELLLEKLTEIINLVCAKKQELNAFNSSSTKVILPKLPEEPPVKEW